MKPSSIKLFDVLFPVATLLVMVSAALSFSGLEEHAMAGYEGGGEGARGMAIWMITASIFILLLLAGILWTTISLLRMGVMRYVLVLVVLYALFHNYRELTVVGPSAGAWVDLAASLVAGAAAAMLFRPGARAWFAENPDDRAAP